MIIATRWFTRTPNGRPPATASLPECFRGTAGRLVVKSDIETPGKDPEHWPALNVDGLIQHPTFESDGLRWAVVEKAAGRTRVAVG